MFYVLKRTDGRGGYYVAEPGQAKAYTTSLTRARRFETVAAAQADACGNERPVAVGL